MFENIYVRYGIVGIVVVGIIWVIFNQRKQFKEKVKDGIFLIEKKKLDLLALEKLINKIDASDVDDRLIAATAYAISKLPILNAIPMIQSVINGLLLKGAQKVYDSLRDQIKAARAKAEVKTTEKDDKVVDKITDEIVKNIKKK